MSEQYRILEHGEKVVVGDEILIRHSLEVTGKERLEPVVNDLQTIVGNPPYEKHKFRRKVG